MVTVAIRNRTSMAVFRVRDEVIVLQTMMSPDEVRSPDFSIESGEVKDAEVKMANMLVETLAGDFDADEFEDDYADAVQELVKAKIEGGEVKKTPTATKSSGEVVDLLAALQPGRRRQDRRGEYVEGRGGEAREEDRRQEDRLEDHRQEVDHQEDRGEEDRREEEGSRPGAARTAIACSWPRDSLRPVEPDHPPSVGRPRQHGRRPVVGLPRGVPRTSWRVHHLDGGTHEGRRYPAVHCGNGRASSSCAERLNRVASSSVRPTSWTATGRPSSAMLHGTDGRGVAGDVPRDQVGDGRQRGERRADRALAHRRCPSSGVGAR